MKKEILLMTTGIFVGTLLCHGGGAAAAGTVAEPSWQPIFVNVNQVQICRMEKKIVRKMREKVEGKN